MINRETAFADLTKQENLEKINIDKILIEPFVLAMKRMQTFFCKNGYINANNYALYFEKYLFGENGYKIIVDDIGKNYGLTNLQNKIITVSKRLFENKHMKSINIEYVLTHEFIHFLVLAGLPFVEKIDGSFEQNPNRYVDNKVKSNSFINEGLTDMLTNAIFKGTILENLFGYYNLSKIVKFAGYINKVEDNFFAFLRGQNPVINNLSAGTMAFIRHAQVFYASYYILNLKEQSKLFHETCQNRMLELFYNEILMEIKKGMFKAPYEYIERLKNFLVFVPVRDKNAYKVFNKINEVFVSQYFSKLKIEDQQRILFRLNSQIEMAYYLEKQICESTKLTFQNTDIFVTIKKDIVDFEIPSQNYKFFIIKEFDKDNGTYIEDLELNIDIKIIDDKMTLTLLTPLKTESFDFDVSNESYEKNTNELIDVYMKNNKFLEKNFDYSKSQINPLFESDKTITQIFQLDDNDKNMKFYLTKNLQNEEEIYCAFNKTALKLGLNKTFLKMLFNKKNIGQDLSSVLPNENTKLYQANENEITNERSKQMYRELVKPINEKEFDF